MACGNILCAKIGVNSSYQGEAERQCDRHHRSAFSCALLARDCLSGSGGDNGIVIDLTVRRKVSCVK